jgi:hypothetical protein
MRCCVAHAQCRGHTRASAHTVPSGHTRASRPTASPYGAPASDAHHAHDDTRADCTRAEAGASMHVAVHCEEPSSVLTASEKVGERAGERESVRERAGERAALHRRRALQCAPRSPSCPPRRPSRRASKPRPTRKASTAPLSRWTQHITRRLRRQQAPKRAGASTHAEPVWLQPAASSPSSIRNHGPHLT